MTENENKGYNVTPNIVQGEDGVYRWTYKMNLFTNPTIFWLVWKIFFFVVIGIFVMIFLMDIHDWGFSVEQLLERLKFLGYFLIGMTALSIIGYLLYAAMMGGYYIVEFEMNENGINHKQVAAQAKKAKNIARATMIAGALSKNVTTSAVGLNAQRTEMYSDFESVRKVKAYPLRHLIKVNGKLSRNQVYAKKEDYEFVKNYIVRHCPNLR